MDKRVAIRQRPPTLRPVEPGLREPPPRTATYYSRSGDPLDPELCTSALAIKGWVYGLQVDDSHPEGPAFTIDYAFEHEEQLVTVRTNASYDEYHWRAGAPEYYRWFQRRITPTEQISILFVPGDEPRIFGVMEPFATIRYDELLQRTRACDDADQLRVWQNQLIDILYEAGDTDARAVREAFRKTALRSPDAFESIRDLATMVRQGTAGDVFEKLATNAIKGQSKLFWAAD